MYRRHKAADTITAVVTSALVLLLAGAAYAHGSMSNPPSRVYVCKNEGPESPKSEACRVAVVASGSHAFYDWNEVSLINAGGRHRELIPDGRLCSAGREKFRGLDLQRADWPATRVSPGPFTLTYHASAPHANSTFEFYITRQGWSPTMPLKWSDLVHIETFTNQNPTTLTNWVITLPQRTGRHILYSIWQRVVGSHEAFYTCSDVDFGGGAPAPAPSLTPTAGPIPPPTPTAARPGGTWRAGTAYGVGDRVTYADATYECIQAHTALAGWEPPSVAALWRRI